MRVLAGGGLQETRSEVEDSPETSTDSGGEEGTASAVVTVTSGEMDASPT